MHQQKLHQQNPDPPEFTPDANPSTSWALPSEALEWLTQFVKQQAISCVVECGSGLSTIALANLGLQQVLALEHEEKWFDQTQAKLQEQGRRSQVDLQLCPLRQISLNGVLLQWYDIRSITPFAADLILVDGPPGNSGILSRYPAPHLLKKFIKPGTWLILDDWHRFQEKEVVKLWLKEIPELQWMQTIPAGNGLAVMQYSNPAS